MIDEWIGLTTTYNRIHEQPEDVTPPVLALRDLVQALDRAVADAYGWSDLQLDHEFRETALGLRYTISESATTEVLDRLLELNHARHADEVRRGLHTGRSRKGSRRSAGVGQIKM